MNGSLRYVTGVGFQFYEEGVVKGLSGAGTPFYDFLLDCEPDAANNTYAVTRTSGQVTKETWTLNATLKLIKSIDYTRSGQLVNQEVRKVFAADGLTVVAQLTVSYTRSGNNVTGASYSRDI